MDPFPDEAHGGVALIISIVAGTLIIIILVVLLVLKFNTRRDPTYKVSRVFFFFPCHQDLPQDGFKSLVKLLKSP